MYQLAKPFFIMCETPMHAGSGDNLGVIDLPIQRERHTSYPKIEASSLKGAIRQSFELKFKNSQDDLIKVHQVFGYDDAEKEQSISSIFKGDEGKYSSAISFTDSRILLFPVKSMKGVFAWITCPNVLNKLKKDLELAGKSLKFNQTISISKASTSSNSSVINNNKVFLEEYTFEAVKESKYDSLFSEIADLIYPSSPDYQYFKDDMKNRIVILNNDDFKDFVNLSTEVITRTKINNETGTVTGGALFNEEYLPAESVLYSLVMISPLFSSKGKNLWTNNGTSQEVMEFFERIDSVIQIGGNMTLGKGISRINFEKSNNTQNGGK